MRLPKLRRKLRAQAKSEYAKGNIALAEYNACIALSENEVELAKFNAKIEAEVNPWNRTEGLVGADPKTWLANLWDWFVANWPAILKIIMTFLPLLMLEPKRNDR
jgi:hypothetical protein